MNRFGSLGDGAGQTSQHWTPPVDVWEAEDEVVYAFDLPGVSEKQITVEHEENSLTVTAERERAQEVSEDRLLRFERRFGYVQPHDQPAAGCEVHVRKPEQQKPRRIEVARGSASRQPVTIDGNATTA